jgi:hypothetical protein
MLKKALGLVITAIMMLGVFGLTACNIDTLDAYKDAGKTSIENYANETPNVMVWLKYYSPNSSEVTPTAVSFV